MTVVVDSRNDGRRAGALSSLSLLIHLVDNKKGHALRDLGTFRHIVIRNLSIERL